MQKTNDPMADMLQITEGSQRADPSPNSVKSEGRAEGPVFAGDGKKLSGGADYWRAGRR